MIKRITISLLMALGCILHSSVSAHPHEFTYQGSLADSGLPVDGLYDMVFHLFSQELGGSSVTYMGLGSVPMNDGLFTVMLNLPAFDGTEYWLQIEVVEHGSGGDYQVLSPRQKITAVPYANYAYHVANHDHIGEPRGLYAEGTQTGIESWATNSGGVGVHAVNSGETGFGFGVYAETSSDQGYAMYGVASNSSGETFGVDGTSQSVQGIGVRGRHLSLYGTYPGVL